MGVAAKTFHVEEDVAAPACDNDGMWAMMSLQSRARLMVDLGKRSPVQGQWRTSTSVA